VSRFGRLLLVVVCVAFGVRVAYVAVAKGGPCDNPVVGEIPTDCAVGDQLFYNAAANRLAEGDGFVEPFDRSADPAPAADHPPLTAVVLAPVSWLADRPPLEWVDDETHLTHHRYTMALLGTVLVALVGLLARRVAGDAAGIVAAAIVALSPNVWVNDGLVMSETVTGVAVVAALLLASALRARPSVARAAALGAACALAALARAELLLLVPLLAVPAAWTAHPRELAPESREYAGRGTQVGARLAARLALPAAAVGASALVVAPWAGYNLARFDERTLLSTNDGIALAGSNCDPVYSGDAIGLTVIAGPDSCIDHPHPPGDQSEVAAVYRERAFDYARDHLGRVPLVAAARVGRTWSVFRPLDMVEFNEGEGREEWVTRLGLVAYYPTLLGAIAGVVVLWRRRDRAAVWALVAPAVAVTVGVAATYGQTRFRAAAEPSLAVLAAVAAAAFLARKRRPTAATAAAASA
jgi:4-amino-4-deoxy-L-arabinose transferase-like glycosyltransferase